MKIVAARSKKWKPEAGLKLIMKAKLFLTAFTAIALLCPATIHAQSAPASVSSTNAPETSLRTLVQQVMTKVKAGKKSESDLTAELKTFDDLVAQAKGAKTDDVAQIIFMKAMLYLQIFDETDKGKAILADLKANYPDTKAGKNVDKILASIDKQAAAKKIQDALAVGATFPDFDEKDLAGKSISVAGYKGKVVLVDFWATWCGPCKAELPNVIATYQKHHADGFEIIGVSLDSDRDALDKFLAKTDGMTWREFFDGQGWSNKLAVKYGVESIPTNFLIGTDGKIIGKGLRGEELESAVANALAKK
jgi:thiol-disulfide isomerase/thioredoxin